MKLTDAVNNKIFLNYLDNLQFMELFNFVNTEDTPILLAFLNEEGYKKDLLKYISELKLDSVSVQHIGKLECQLDSNLKSIKDKFQFLLTLLYTNENFGYEIDLGNYNLLELPDSHLNHLTIQNIWLQSGWDEDDLASVIHNIQISFYGTDDVISFQYNETFDYDDDHSQVMLQQSLYDNFSFLLRVLFNSLRSKLNYFISDLEMIW